MYKRFKKDLKRTNEEDGSSDESQDSEIQPSDNIDQADIDFALVEAQPDKPRDVNEGLTEVAVVTEGDLEHGSDDPDAEYRCSLCPKKVLASLEDVKKHLLAKVLSLQSTYCIASLPL